MQLGVMITNGGPHPASKWAETTVNQLVRVDDSASEIERQAGNVLKDQLLRVLEDGHVDVQEAERGKLADNMLHLHTDIVSPEAHVDYTMDMINKVADKSPYAAHFRQPQVQAYARQVLTEHYMTSMDVERSWHADHNEDHPAAAEYRELRDLHGSHHVGKMLAVKRAVDAVAD